MTSAGTSSRTGLETFITSVTSPVYSCLISNSWVFFFFFPKHSEQHPKEIAPGKERFFYFSSLYLISVSVTNLISTVIHSSWMHGNTSRKHCSFSFPLLELRGGYFISKCEYLHANAHTLRSTAPSTLSTSYMWYTEWSHQNAQRPAGLNSSTLLTPLTIHLRGKQHYNLHLWMD